MENQPEFDQEQTDLAKRRVADVLGDAATDLAAVRSVAAVTSEKTGPQDPLNLNLRPEAKGGSFLAGLDADDFGHGCRSGIQSCVPLTVAMVPD